MTADVRVNRTRTHVAILIAAALVAAGCSGGASKDPSTSIPSASAPTTTTATASTPAPTTAPISTTATTTSRTATSPEPTSSSPVPTGQKTDAGEREFVARYIEALPPAYKTLKTATLKSMSRTRCIGCTDLIAPIDHAMTNGDRFTPLELKVDGIQLHTNANATGMVDQVRVTVDLADQRELGRDGHVIQKFPSGRAYWLMQLLWVGDHWSMDEFALG